MIYRILRHYVVKRDSLFICIGLIFILRCAPNHEEKIIQTVDGAKISTDNDRWLTHEHILVDFIGAESISSSRWDADTVVNIILPHINELDAFQVTFFVDATPNYLGRDMNVLKSIAERSGINVITNTGLYGAQQNKFIPQYAFTETAMELADRWITEFKYGINGSATKPGFIKISVDSNDTLDIIHQKLVKAAAITHRQTGLTIGSHTGKAIGLFPQLAILEEMGVSPEAFIWIHAQSEENNEYYLKAATQGCWISMDGIGWEIESYVVKLVFARDNRILNKILLSHDAGWYDPAKSRQEIKPYTNIFEKLIPILEQRGFTKDDFKLLLSTNPGNAFRIKKRLLD